MIDFSKVAAGDKVLIEAKVVQVDKNDPERPLGVSIGEDLILSNRWPHKDAFVSHIPRGPEVGDEVQVRPNGISRFIVLGIDGNEAWVRGESGYPGEFNTRLFMLSDLAVTKRKSSI